MSSKRGDRLMKRDDTSARKLQNEVNYTEVV
ncbi:DUF485 domain-containing protein, partial [Bacillus thuringiensis]|nr:DUF485 domain-containing protein [Bacillus thuringiensis]